MSSSDRFGARRLAAVWFADVVGFTRLASVDEDTALAVVADFHRVARSEVERHGGRVVKLLGDGALAEFASAGSAARAALAVRRGFGSSGEGREVAAVRIGIHLGEVLASPDGDLYGDGVNTASRLHGTAAPGEVVVSDDVWRQLRRRPGFQFQSLGERSLRGLDEPVVVHRLLSGPERGEGGAGADEHEPARRFLPRRAVAVVAAVAVVISLTGLVAWSLREPAGAIAVADAVEPTTSIAVLPFEDMSGDPEKAYFSDGITEEILDALAQVGGLRVVARTSSFAFKGSNEDVRAIGRKLGVATVLEGSVRWSGERVRITAQLIDAGNGYHLWSKTYERELEDIFAIQDEISRAIVNALELRLAPGQEGPLVEAPTRDLIAYQLYLRGRQAWNERTPEALEQAIALFDSVLDRDPGFALAYSGLADSYAFLEDYGSMRREEAFPKAIEAATHALEIDERLAEAHASIGHVAMHQGEWEMSEQAFRRALELKPSYAVALHWYSLLLAWTGRSEEALIYNQRAQAADPLSTKYASVRPILYYYSHRFDEALAAAEKAVEATPTSTSYYILGLVYGEKEMHEEAIAAMERSVELAGDERWRKNVVYAYARAGRAEEARAMLPDLEARWGEDPVVRSRLAGIYLLVGERERAFGLLEELAVESPGTVAEVVVAPTYDPVRSHPRFQKVWRRLGLK